jgi:hypothetical protein
MLPDTISRAFLTLYYLSLDFIQFLGGLLQSRSALAAENLFLRTAGPLPGTSTATSMGQRRHAPHYGLGGKTV